MAKIDKNWRLFNINKPVLELIWVQVGLGPGESLIKFTTSIFGERSDQKDIFQLDNSSKN